MKREPILRSEKVTVEFDGFVAVREMSFELADRELRFLIGPNGAGKTTFLDVICGKVRPKNGQVLYRAQSSGSEVPLTRRKEHQIASLGIARKFQAPSIFTDLTVFENLELSVQKKKGILAAMTTGVKREMRDRIQGQLEMIGLSDKSGFRAGGLSHGEKQWLEIGMMLLQDPRVLLLDEPVAGMTDAETEKTGELLKEITRERAVVVVEHDMEFVRNYSSLVTVMHEGQLLKEGTMSDIQSDDRVAEVYLGKKAG
ncbi:urea ABC transporter ATP-binding protein UrtD [Marinicrinis sediminis]|uniref:Urea ABC transporter ATP-binding protein UrtD n=1 Tax=Marinicrinis sediminis TaxID=1652465 RepID=A0ABW5R9E2_9BACL